MRAKELANQVSRITGVVQHVSEGQSSIEWLMPFTPAQNATGLEGVLFVKPEGTALKSGVEVERILTTILEKLDSWNLEIEGAAVLGAQYLEQHDIIANHYGVINRISRNGQEAISDDAKQKLQELFNEELSAGAKVLGGHQVLAQHPELSPRELDDRVSAAGGKKLAPGTYCAKLTLNDQTLLVLNGFHPYQLEHFTAPGRSIVTFLVRGQGDWKAIRNEMLGATNPSAAAEGSLRRQFLDQREQFKLEQVNQGNNIVHFSAGPLEGMVETVRYFSNAGEGRSVAYSDTTFGKLLEQNGFSADEIERLAANPQIEADGRRVSAFDLTEEQQPEAAVKLLKQA